MDTFTFQSYEDIRQIEHIIDTGTPFFEDELQQTSQGVILSPLFHYIITFFTLFLGLNFALTLIPALALATIPVIVYFFAKKAIKEDLPSILAALLTLSVPSYFMIGANTVSPHTLLIPLLLLATYFFSRLGEGSKFLYLALASLFVSTFIHPATIVLCLGLILYLIIIRAQNFRETSREPEVVLSLFFFLTWFNLLLYRDALSFHGFNLLRGNTPSSYLDTIYPILTLQGLIDGVGILPLILGLISAYLVFVESKRKTASLLISLILILIVFLQLRLIPYVLGTATIGFFCSVLGVYSISYFYKKSEELKIKYAQIGFIVLLVILTAGLGSIHVEKSNTSSMQAPTTADVEAYNFLQNISQNNSVIITLPFEANSMTHLSGKTHIINTNFLLTHNANTIVDDTQRAYSIRFLTDLLQITESHDVTHILLSETNQLRNNITSLAIDNPECLPLIYNETAKIYEIQCSLVNR